MISHHIAAQRRDELSALVAAHGGAITPAQVVNFARNPATALHGLFVWDDTEAARKYREVQAQTYLRAVVRLIPRENDEPVSVRAFVSLSTDRGSSVYRPIVDVLNDDEARAVLVADAQRELAALKQKYAHLQELAHVWDAIAEPVRLAA
jgi:hypothetical protein